jgi:ubiquitin-conjugating enzyme E2 D/E
MAAARRLAKELQSIARDTEGSNVTATPVETGNLFHWRGSMQGPPGTPYEGGIFALDISFPPEYPSKPPKVRFVTRIYHANVSDDGGICLDILRDQWSPVLSIAKVLLSISSLLTDPNPDHGLRPDAVKQLRSDRPSYDRTAKEWTAKYAQP